jgi:hypothetical protein
VFGVIGFVIWLYLKYGRSVLGPDGPVKFFTGPVPGPNPGALSGPNLKGWWEDLFGGADGEYDPTQTVAEDQAALARATAPTEQGLQQSIQDLEQSLQNYRSDPASMPFF